MSRRRWTSIAASAALALVLGGCAGGAHPALGVLSRYEPAAAGGRHLNPYFANLYAREMVDAGDGADDVRAYLDWYLSALNYPDRHGLTGTVYDRDLHHGGRETETGAYDSADSYAATFLVLLEAYTAATGDAEPLARNGRRVLDVAWLLVALQDPDGLVRALPDGNVRYLMDNCEVYAGLLAAASLAGRLETAAVDTAAAAIAGRLGPRFRTAAADVRAAVLTRLWQPAEQRFDWAEAAGRRYPADWARFYPDALAQIFPVLYGLLDHDPAARSRLWAEFARRYDHSGGPATSPAQRVIIDLTRERMERS